MLHCWIILEEVSVWKINDPIHVCGPEINRHKSSATDCKSEMLEKCKTAKQLAEINLDEKGNLLAINKVELF